MNTTTRTDIHRPADFDPEQYVYVGSYDNQGSNPGVVDHETGELLPWWTDTMMPALDAMYQAADAGRIAYGTGARCDHCGAHIRYVGLFRHTPTGDVIAVGERCADGRMTYSKADFDRLRKAAQLDRQAARIKAAWDAFRAEHADVDWDALAESTNLFIGNVLGKGRRNGRLSDRQVEAIVTAHQRDIEEANERAEREANALPTMPVPTGNGVTITGVVLGIKGVDTDWGTTWKMLVESTVDGHTFKVWGSIPSAIYPERGDTVQFVANVERSDDDPAFGFFKRPRKAIVVTEAVA